MALVMRPLRKKIALGQLDDDTALAIALQIVAEDEKCAQDAPT